MSDTTNEAGLPACSRQALRRPRDRSGYFRTAQALSGLRPIDITAAGLSLVTLALAIAGLTR